MHPDIAAFPNELFYRQEQLQPVPLSHQLEERLDYNEPSQDALDDALKRHRVLFLPINYQLSTINFQLSTFNCHLSPVTCQLSEATLVADVLRRLYRQIGSERFDAARSIGVIVTYRHQITMIRREMVRLGLSELEDISIDTVERYQGSQRDVIIYSTGVQNEAELDFLTSNCFEENGDTVDRKLNVAITRARKQLIMIGKEALLRQNAIFSDLIARYSI
jgi:superfamily I DNA and/or RNA helicase